MAIEAAIKIARLITKRQEIISLKQSYHGMSYGALWCTGYDGIVLPFGPRDPRHRLANSYRCSECAFHSSYPRCGVRCAEEIARLIAQRRRKLAAVVAEPVLSNQVIVPPAEFWPRVSRACRENGVPLIADEVVSGLGRCGAWLGCDLVGMTPDLIALGKGMTSGVLPMAALLHGARIASALEGKTLLHGQTFDGYGLGAEAALALIDIIESENLLHRAGERGAYLKAWLLELQRCLPAIAEVRGWGLLWGVEISRSAVPGNQIPAFAANLQNALQDEGILLGGLGRVLIFAPPFVISEEEIDEGVRRFERALKKTLSH